MEAVDKLKTLYDQRDSLNSQIEKIEELLGAEPGEVKVRRKRGPNKPKGELPANGL